MIKCNPDQFKQFSYDITKACNNCLLNVYEATSIHKNFKEIIFNLQFIKTSHCLRKENYDKDNGARNNLTFCMLVLLYKILNFYS